MRFARGSFPDSRVQPGEIHRAERALLLQRFCQNVITSPLNDLIPQIAVINGRDEDEGTIAVRRGYLLEKLAPVETRQVAIAENDNRPAPFERRQRLCACTGEPEVPSAGDRALR